MRPIWMIQTNMEDVDTGPMINAVDEQIMSVIPIEHTIGMPCDFSAYDPHDCIACYGDIDFVRQIQKKAPFVPGAWCNFYNMKCSTYYSHLGEHLLNSDYTMMPIGDLLRRWDKFVIPGYPDMFVRPDSGAKPFTGQVIRYGEEHKIQALLHTVGPETLVLIAPSKTITSEYRFVICDKRVVAGCQYLPIELPNYSTTSLRLASVIANHDWQPDLCYTVDIAEHDGRMYLLEINSFSCACMYQCDIGVVVQYASLAAKLEWNNYVDPANN